MLHRILSGFDPDEYCLLSRESYARDKTAENAHGYLPACYFDLPPANHSFRIHWLRPWQLREAWALAVPVLHRAREIIRILREHPAESLIACSGDVLDIPAGYLACLFLGIPFFAYIFDDYVYQWQGLPRRFAKFVAPLIFKYARGVIGPNEFVCDEYRLRYQSNCIIIRNPCNRDELEETPYPHWPAAEGRIVIMYTGAIYHANYDCFRNLAAAVNLMDSENVEVHIFTAQEPDQVKEQGIQGRNIFFHSHIPYQQILETQRKADILFLPLAFESPIPEVIRTSAPGKLGEYLASGRPVLAHVPPDSFVAHYLKEHNCAAVVDSNQPADLVQTIETLIVDSALRKRIICNARRQAEMDFSPEVACKQLDDFLERMMNKR